MSPIREVARSCLARLARALPFLLAWAFLDALFNLRYPGDETAPWYLLPSIDVVAVMAVFAVLGARGLAVPTGARRAIVAVGLTVRVFRWADGLVERNLHRPLSLYLDVPQIPNLVRLLRSTVSLPRILLGVLLAAVGAVLVSMVTARALSRVQRALSSPGPRRLFVAVLIGCAALSPVWPQAHSSRLHVGLFGASIVPRLWREISFLRHAGEFRRQYTGTIVAAQGRLRALPATLDRLHRADVLLFVVESYGETVIEQAAYARRMAPVYQAFEGELGRRGFASASSLLSSPTYGGGSWLAHASMATGVRTENGLAYSLLLQTQPRPLTMARAFQGAGYRTVLVQPGTTRRWPEGEVTGFEQKYYAMDMDYRGPSFKWATMPDQYVIDFIHRREVAAAGRAPLFIEYDLVSSHSPWSVQPRVVPDWASLGDGGAIFRDMPPILYPLTWSNLEDGGDAYVTSLLYDFEVLRRYLTERVAGGALVIILGDHQPSALVTANSPSPGVPIHVLSRDRTFIERFVAAGYLPGMHAASARPLVGLEMLLPQLLRMFSSPPAARLNDDRKREFQ